ncbi:MAG: FliI/YscN family ATPase [Pseudomonadota bacterium]
MSDEIFERMRSVVRATQKMRPVGAVAAVRGSHIEIKGLDKLARPGDRFRLIGHPARGEVIALAVDGACGMLDEVADGIGLGDKVILEKAPRLAPHDDWIGRVIDPDGAPLDGRPLLPGMTAVGLSAAPPPPAKRRSLGHRLPTGMSVFDTLLPIVQGQRIGLFSGSGVGKSTLLANLATGVQADVIVIALVGERGREVREFVEKTLGADGMKRSIVVAATSDRPAQVRRRCPLAATAIAEFFRDQGKDVLLLVDSVTRLAEAHREVAVTGGEAASLRGFPPSTASMIAGLCERAGPGVERAGAITAIYTVLVAGSDMEEPVADMLRGVLDGHVVLDREIAERGRFPAIDVPRSVSRSLPDAATEAENRLIQEARRHLAQHARSELMIQSGLYVSGSDPRVDAAVACFEGLDEFIASPSPNGIVGAFHQLGRVLQAASHVAP